MSESVNYTTGRSLSALLDDLHAMGESDPVTVGDLLEAFHERGFGVLLLIFALPAAIPLPGLGINLIVAAPLVILSLQQALGADRVRLPPSLCRRAISAERLKAVVDSARPWARRIEPVLKPRLVQLTQGRSMNIIGILGLMMALSVCVPLPLTNTVPGMGIAIMAVGLLARDGIFVIVGAMLGSLWVITLWGALLIFGMAGIAWLHTQLSALLP
jgi:hypothetical protein